MDTDEILNAVLTPENLHWAWQKVLKHYQSDSSWKDDVEIASFEKNIRQELDSISKDIRDKSYICQPLKPIPQPKKRDEHGNLQVRQFFWISVRDQITWIAFVNIIGPVLDNMMPRWSFGNRLHRSIWYENDDIDRTKKIKIGHYRHTSGLVYRKFSQGWPLYRRFIYLTLKRINYFDSSFNLLNLAEIDDLDEIDSNLLETELNTEAGKKLEYLLDDYWKGGSSNAYWASIDFKQFYPNLDLNLIKAVILKRLSVKHHSELEQFINRLFDFRIDNEDFEPELLTSLGIQPNIENISILPTGLIVAGFLANCAMLDIDDVVTQKSKQFQIAHFRYVDDHVVISNDFNNLVNWLNFYASLVEEYGVASINKTKTIPEELSKLLNPEEQIDYSTVEKACKVDPIYPKPLMTKTLNRVSQLAQLDFEFIDESEKESTLNDLELLLLADINDSELPETTRISFAATLISRITSHTLESNESIFILSELHRKIFELEKELKKNDSFLNVNEDLNPLSLKLNQLKREFIEKKIEYETIAKRKLSRSFSLLMKAIHENPEKLRLWQRSIDFCFKTGFNGIRRIQSEIRLVLKESEIVGVYIQSLVFIYISQCILSALSDADTKELPSEDKLKLIRFVDSVMSSLSDWEHPSFQPYYFVRSFKLLLVTCQQASELLLFLKLRFTPLERAVIESESINSTLLLFENRDLYGPITNDYLANWIWWADRISSLTFQSLPSAIWTLTSNKLEIDSDSSWSVWQLYPNHLPQKAKAALFDGVRYFPENYNGWLIDAVGEDEVLFSFKLTTTLPIPVINYLSSYASETFFPLPKWVNWAVQNEPETYFDPRISEWTCLEILKQTIEQLIEGGTDSKNFKLHPTNILIPVQWTQIDASYQYAETQVPTWESWKRMTSNEDKLVTFSRENEISDYRYNAAQGNDWSQIESFGLILLGLIKKDFKLPSLWTSYYQSPAIINSMKTMIGEVNCSSLTTGILEATLLPASRELYLLDSLFQADIPKDIDTTYTPPQINNLSELLREVKKSQQVLEKYQFSVSGHKPIQLIPMSIEQSDRFTPQQNQINEVSDD